MKKAFITLGLSAVVGSSGFAQGLLYFGNSGLNPVKVVGLNGVATSMPTSATPNYYFALFYSNTASTVDGSAAPLVASETVTSDPNWIADPGVLGGNNSSGRAGGFADLAANASVNGTYVPATISDPYLVVLGWSANIGSTIASLEAYENGTDGGVVSGYFGQSAPAATALSAGGLATINSINLASFDLGPILIPEPTTMALGVLGGLSWLALRRKKA